MPEFAFSHADAAALEEAVRILRSPSLAIRLANAVGMPIERFISRLPARLSGGILEAASRAIERALDVAVNSLEAARRPAPANALHKLACGASGGLGGFFGIPALVVELPVSTTLMLRSIADIARGAGEDLRDPATQVACLEVFALGGVGSGDDAAEAGYFAVRGALAAALREAAQFIAQRGIAGEGAPVLARLVAQVAARFGAAVSEKAAAQAVPVLGAIGGAAVNVVFMDHFQNMARAHFTIRALERQYGPGPVRAAVEAALARG